MNKSEKERNCKTVLKVDKATNQVGIFKLDNSGNPSKDFTFD
jgi:hypothetical protein